MLMFINPVASSSTPAQHMATIMNYELQKGITKTMHVTTWKK
jgi:hypothetical protein